LSVLTQIVVGVALVFEGFCFVTIRQTCAGHIAGYRARARPRSWASAIGSIAGDLNSDWWFSWSLNYQHRGPTDDVSGALRPFKDNGGATNNVLSLKCRRTSGLRCERVDENPIESTPMEHEGKSQRESCEP